MVPHTYAACRVASRVRAYFVVGAALKRLLADIGSGLVYVVVVYKVDRLTRSLADFAKMVEVFDTHGVSFVAVTQQFNTTTSMGHLDMANDRPHSLSFSTLCRSTCT